MWLDLAKGRLYINSFISPSHSICDRDSVGHLNINHMSTYGQNLLIFLDHLERFLKMLSTF